MQFQTSGQPQKGYVSSALRKRTLAERLLSFVGPKTLFLVIGGGVLVSAALVLTLVTALGPQDNTIVKALQSYAGYDPAGSFDYNYSTSALGVRCPAGTVVDQRGRCVPAPRTAQLQLSVAISPNQVAPGGSYTLTARYTDANGQVVPYSGLLDVQLNLCQISSPSSCQFSASEWGNYQVVNGSVKVDLPTTIAQGIYKASFRPRGQTAWAWSNEAVITVAAATPPVGGASKIAIASAYSESVRSGYPASNAIDGSVNTMWNSGNSAPRSIKLDLGNYYNVTSLRFNIQKTPSGTANHEIYASACDNPTQLINSFAENNTTGQWKDQSVNANQVRYIIIKTTSSPSWVAWNEIEAYGTPTSFTGSCGSNGGGDGGGGNPNPTNCLSGSVTLINNNIVVNTYTTAGSTLSGFAITYESDNQNIATVEGTRITAKGIAGFANISGRYVYAGRSCSLTSARLTVTGGDADGTVTTTAREVYNCTNNGISTSATIVVKVTRGTGKVEITGPVNFSGAAQLTAGNEWRQVVTTGNFNGLNGAPNGLSATIKLLDYFTGALIKSETITARLNPTGTCPQPGQPSLTVGTVYAACTSSMNGYVDSISAVSGTGSSSRVIGNGRMLFSIDPNGTVTQNNVNIGFAKDNDPVSFTLVQDGSNRVLAGPVTKTVQANTSCSPTGTITPNTSYVSTCALSGRPSSVTLSASITTPFGEGDIVVGTGSYPGGTFGRVVAGGGAKTFTVNASQMDLYSAVTFNIKTAGGSFVSGAGAVVYRDDRNCGASQNPTYTRFDVNPLTASACPLSTKNIDISVEGATAPGYVQINDRYNLTLNGTTYGLSQTLGFGVPQTGQRSFSVTLQLTGGQPVTRTVVLTADSAACS